MSPDSTSLILLRTEFALTAAYHYLFVPVSIGLIVLIATMESLYLKTGREAWRRAAKFWGWFFFLSWTMGLVTGLPLRWQLTNNWAGYGVYVREIIDRVLLLEAYIAPLMIGLGALFYFGWQRMNRYLHCAVTWLLVCLLCAQAAGMLVLNAWMQHPVGAEFVNGKAIVTSLQAILLNPTAIDKITHALSASIATGCMFVFSISASYCLKQSHRATAIRSLKLATVIGTVASVSVFFTGHSSAYDVAEFQPLKFAAFEGIWTTPAAPAGITLIAIPDVAHQQNSYEIKLPYLLSFLMAGDAEYAPAGMRDIVRKAIAQHDTDDANATARAQLPNVPLLFFSFRAMVLSGILTALAFGVGIVRSDAIVSGQSRLLIHICMFAFPLPWIGTLAGWIVAEAGRQPWLVYGVLSTRTAVSAVVPEISIMSFICIVCAYLLLGALYVIACLNYIRIGPAIDKALPWPYPTEWRDILGGLRTSVRHLQNR